MLANRETDPAQLPGVIYIGTMMSEPREVW